MTPCPKPEPRQKKRPKPIPPISEKRKAAIAAGLVELKVVKPLRKVSAKQAQHEREKSKAYRQRSQNERPFCRGCGSYTSPLSNSHRIGQANKEHVANPANLDTYCIDGKDCHRLFESGRIWSLDNGNEVLEWLAETDWERYSAKVWKMLDRINEMNLSQDDLPEWVETHVLAVTK